MLVLFSRKRVKCAFVGENWANETTYKSILIISENNNAEWTNCMLYYISMP